jgi:hypothetical protein
MTGRRRTRHMKETTCSKGLKNATWVIGFLVFSTTALFLFHGTSDTRQIIKDTSQPVAPGTYAQTTHPDTDTNSAFIPVNGNFSGGSSHNEETVAH